MLAAKEVKAEVTVGFNPVVSAVSLLFLALRCQYLIFNNSLEFSF